MFHNKEVYKIKIRWFSIIFIVFLIGFLSGCNQLEELLDKGIQFLDQQLSEEATSNNNDGDANQNDLGNDSGTNDGDVNNNEEVGAENNQQSDNNSGSENAVATNSDLPFDERLIEQGYELKTVPNGFPFAVPYHWILVDDNLSDDKAEQFSGKFCFDLPLEIEDVASYFDSIFSNISHQPGDGDIIYSSSFSENNEFQNMDVTLDYFLDQHDNTCVNANIVYAINADDVVGEDPDTMISDEEWEEYENMDFASDRNPSYPDDFDESIETLKNNPNLFNEDGALSIKDQIRNRELEMVHLISGYPKIFPYEWYLLEELETSGWSGTFCTDTSFNQSILKHLSMLESRQADIEYLALEGSVRPNVVAELGFEFNDEYGTGSWEGTTLFFISPDGTYPMNKCSTVFMEFSDKILD